MALMRQIFLIDIHRYHMFAMVDFQDGSLVEVQYSAFFPASQHLEAMQIQIPHLIHQQSMQASKFS